MVSNEFGRVWNKAAWHNLSIGPEELRKIMKKLSCQDSWPMDQEWDLGPFKDEAQALTTESRYSLICTGNFPQMKHKNFEILFHIVKFGFVAMLSSIYSGFSSWRMLSEFPPRMLICLVVIAEKISNVFSY